MTDGGCSPTDPKVAAAAAKKHPHRHGQRPRSKSCDLHRRSPTLHKPRKYPTHHKIVPGTHSPGGRNTPKSLYRGNMWVRPVAVRAPAKYVGAYGRVAPFASEQGAHHVDEATVGTDFGPFSHVRQVSQSPVLDDDEAMMAFASPCTSFDSYGEGGVGPTGSPKAARITFGESGKPIKPRRVAMGVL
ncbi:hypothetical protein ACHAXT_009685 [Thalassiosira profunda]